MERLRLPLTSRRLGPPAAVLALAILVPLASVIPSCQGYRAADPPNRVFMGFRYMPDDHFQYAAFMRQARDTGSPLMQNLFTSEPQRGSFVLLYFWLVGMLCRATGMALTTAWEIFRVAGGFGYIVLFWAFTAAYIRGEGRRIIATALFATAGGLDWVVSVLRATVLPAVKPLEYASDFFWNWSTFGTLAMPNWIWPAMLILLACHLLLRPARLRQMLIAVLLPAVWFLHPHSGTAVYVCFGLLPFMPLLTAAARRVPLPWDRFRSNLGLALPGLASFVIVASYIVWARTDSVFAANSAGVFSWTFMFPVWWYPLTYGALLPLAWFGLRDIARVATIENDLILSWAAAAFLLSINPVYSGVKFQYLLFPPLVIVAARGLFHLTDVSAGFRKTIQSGPAAVALAAALCLNAPVALVKVLAATDGTPEIFMPAAEIAAMAWLETQPDGVVLCSDWSGNRIPMLSGKKVYIGHWFMTLDLNDKKRLVARFFAPETPLAVKREILRSSGARYIYYGAAEAAQGRVDSSLSLAEIYRKDGIVIYRF